MKYFALLGAALCTLSFSATMPVIAGESLSQDLVQADELEQSLNDAGIQFDDLSGNSIEALEINHGPRPLPGGPRPLPGGPRPLPGGPRPMPPGGPGPAPAPGFPGHPGPGPHPAPGPVYPGPHPAPGPVHPHPGYPYPPYPGHPYPGGPYPYPPYPRMTYCYASNERGQMFEARGSSGPFLVQRAAMEYCYQYSYSCYAQGCRTY